MISVGDSFFTALSPMQQAVAKPRLSQANQLRQQTFTMLLRFLLPGCGRVVTVMSPRSFALRSAFCAVVLQQPA
jgi:hypothetical protein